MGASDQRCCVYCASIYPIIAALLLKNNTARLSNAPSLSWLISPIRQKEGSCISIFGCSVRPLKNSLGRRKESFTYAYLHAHAHTHLFLHHPKFSAAACKNPGTLFRSTGLRQKVSLLVLVADSSQFFIEPRHLPPPLLLCRLRASID